MQRLKIVLIILVLLATKVASMKETKITYRIVFRNSEMFWKLVGWMLMVKKLVRRNGWLKNGIDWPSLVSCSLLTGFYQDLWRIRRYLTKLLRIFCKMMSQKLSNYLTNLVLKFGKLCRLWWISLRQGARKFNSSQFEHMNLNWTEILLINLTST